MRCYTYSEICVLEDSLSEQSAGFEFECALYYRLLYLYQVSQYTIRDELGLLDIPNENIRMEAREDV